MQARLPSIKYEISNNFMPQPSGLSGTAKTRAMTYLNCGAP